MYLADYHIHSDCSGDGTASMADMAAAAVAAGLREVCFTDHLDVPRAGEQPYPLDTQRLTEQRQLAQQRWGERLTIRLGVELGEMVEDFRQIGRASCRERV